MAAVYSSTSYHNDLLQKLRQQREEGLYCDFSLHVEDQVFKVHKCILAANSPMMQTMLGSESDIAKFVVLAKLSARAVKTVLDFMYTGQLYITDLYTCAEEIWNAAKLLKVLEIEDMCNMYLKGVRGQGDKYVKGKMLQDGSLECIKKGIEKPYHFSSGLADTNIVISVVKKPEDTSASYRKKMVSKRKPTCTDTVSSSGRHLNVGHHLDNSLANTTDVEMSLKKKTLNNNSIWTQHDQLADSCNTVTSEAVERNINGVYECAEKIYEKQSDSMVTVKMEELESEPIVWEAEKEGELVLRKIEEKVAKNEIIHVEHPYAQNSDSIPGSSTTPASKLEQSSQGQTKGENVGLDYVCAICNCNLLIKTKIALIRHVKACVPHSRKKFAMSVKCLHCTKRFLHKQVLINHMRSAHLSPDETDRIGYVNYLVANAAVRASAVAALRTQRMKTGRFSCSFCERMCRSRKALTRHVLKKHQQLKFKCLICRRAFPSHESLLSHKRYAHQVKISCEVCGDKFNSVIGARKHTAEKHKEESVPVFSCKFCYSKFPMVSLLHVHTCKDRGNLICRICTRPCLTFGHYERHLKDDQRRGYTCEICFKTFGRQCTLKKQKYAHNQESYYLCRICRKKVLKVNKESHLNDHKTASTDSDGKITYHWECPKCKKRMDDLRFYLLHLKRHQNECDICGLGYLQPDHLKKHRAKHRDSEIVCDHCGKRFRSSSSYNLHASHNMCREASACPFCGEMFNKWGIFTRHVKKHKITAVHKKRGSGEYYKCPKCDRLIKFFHYLQLHLRSHESGKPYKCQHCDKGFMKTNCLNRHLTVAHNIPVAKVHVCTICKEKLLTPKFLTNHMLIYHECEGCGKTFEKKEDKLAHEATVHQDMQGRYVCETCEKQFSFPAAFQRHKRYHKTSQQRSARKKREIPPKCPKQKQKTKKRFEGICDICGVVYHTKEGLETHMRKHAGENLDYVCSLCGAVYQSESGLRKHVKKHSGEESRYECGTCGAIYHSRDGLKDHMMKHTGEGFRGECNICGAVLHTKSGLRRHVNNHFRKEEDLAEKVACEWTDIALRIFSEDTIDEEPRTDDKFEHCK